MNKWKCEKCGKQFKQKSHWNYHVNKRKTSCIHPKWKCEKCGKKFRQKNHWNYHVNKRKTSCKYVTVIITKKKIDL